MVFYAGRDLYLFILKVLVDLFPSPVVPNRPSPRQFFLFPPPLRLHRNPNLYPPPPWPSTLTDPASVLRAVVGTFSEV